MVWIPRFHDIRAILSFGSISSLGNLANMAGTSAPDLIMGKVLNMAAVGYYSRATGLVQLFARLISGALTPLVLPYFSQVQREGKPLTRPYLMAVEHLTALAWPFFACLLVLAYPIVRALYGATWDASVPVARLLCLASSLSALTLFAPQAMVASGGLRSSTLCNLFVQPIRIIAVLVSAPKGMVAVAGSIVVAEAIALMINSFFLYRVVGVRSREVLRACTRSLLITAASVAGPIAVLIACGDAPSSSWPPLLAGVASATTGWLAALWLTRHPLGAHVLPMIGLTMKSAPPVSTFTFKQRLRSLAYRCGLLSGWHRLRNANTLTVAMFHRVLPRIDPRFAGADPEWTMTPESFEQCLLFFARHYNVVTPNQVFAAMRGEASLPPCSLLITFDDGWADTAEFAQPLLDRQRMAGLIFVASDVIGSIRPFWEEQIFSFLATAPHGMTHLNELLARKGLPMLSGALDEKASEATIRQCISQLGKLPREHVIDLVASLPCNDNTAAMIDQAQLIKLARAPHMIGGHGKTHQPLTRIQELDEELASAQSTLATILGSQIESMSFPHGAASPSILEACHAAGYRYLFSSKAHLNKFGSASVHTSTAGRIHISERAITGADRRVDPALLASILFLRPHASLTADG
jgi:peptidoglycan/xylan/chitin deacetylase (PgdA/CDA1 family)